MEMFLSGKYRTLVVRIYGELDHHSAALVRESADRELIRTGAVNIAFDFSNVTFMDSSGIGVIMGRYKTARALGGKVIICGASDAVRRIIKMSGTEKLIVMADSLEEGLKEAVVNV
jgi:stage II sporulation protein AA (anti-sigma F factor antagonist)